MKGNRELFEAWAYSKKWNIYRVRDMGMDRYVDDFVDGAWSGWQASASREGYKLVPLELVDEIEDKIWDNLSANHTITNQEGDGFIPVEDIDLGGIYKAMIGVGE